MRPHGERHDENEEGEIEEDRKKTMKSKSDREKEGNRGKRMEATKEGWRKMSKKSGLSIRRRKMRK